MIASKLFTVSVSGFVGSFAGFAEPATGFVEPVPGFTGKESMHAATKFVVKKGLADSCGAFVIFLSHVCLSWLAACFFFSELFLSVFLSIF